MQLRERIHERLALRFFQLLAQPADLGGARAHLLVQALRRCAHLRRLAHQCVDELRERRGINILS